MDFPSPLKVLRYFGRTPVFATCERCHLKFFTPHDMLTSPEEAIANLQEKFEMHACKARQDVLPIRGA